MIVKNEEDVIGRCLESVKDVFDEIIIVDTGSTDKTKAIVKKYTNNIYDFKWENDFSKARNYSFSKATMDYIMWLDADDVVDLKNVKKLIQLKESIKDVDGIMMKYIVDFDELNNPTFSYYRERLVKRSNNYKWVGKVHEVLDIDKKLIYSDIEVIHKRIKWTKSDRNLRIYEEMIKSNQLLNPREKFYYARELYYNDRFDEAIKVFNEFLNDDLGWIENNIEACKNLAECYYSLKDNRMALRSLIRSFEYDEPRAEICCLIGNWFFMFKEYAKAISWYLLATNKKPNVESGAFVRKDYYKYIPYIQLCVCYGNLNDFKTAEFYNKKAGLIKPKDKVYLFNKNYFAQLKIKKKKEG